MAENYRRALTEEEIPPAFKNVYGDRTKKPISVQATETLVDVASPLPTIVDIEKELDKKDPSYVKIAGLAGLELLGSAAPVVELAARSANKSVLQKIVNYFKKNPDKEYNPKSAKVSAKDLGFGEDVYHFTTSKEIKGDKFNPDLSIGNWNRMGIHVGAKKAAADRFRQTQGIDKYEDGKALTELSPGEYFEADAKGMTIPLKARIDKPLLFDGEIQSEFAIIGKLQEMAVKKGIGKDGDYATALRKELAKEGYTHIPYINEVENEGAISYIMLTDRPKGSSAVMRSRFADFDLNKIDKPELGFAEGGDTVRPEPRPEAEVDVSPRAEAGDQFFVREAERKRAFEKRPKLRPSMDKSFPDVKPKLRPGSEIRTDVVSEEYTFDGNPIRLPVLVFKDGGKIAFEKALDNIIKAGNQGATNVYGKSADGSMPALEDLSDRVKNFIELNNPTREEFETYWYNPQVNKGGLIGEQMQMAFMMNEGGLTDDGMNTDPVSGNEVPSGSMAEEVRDNIPAQLSEGEYVVPADVVRYYGVKFFEDLRDEAKRGLADMEANGRIGGEPVPAGGPKNESLTSEEQQAVEAMMGMEQGGAVQNPYLQQQQLYNQEPSKAVGNTMGYSGGGSSAPVNQLQTQAITPTVYNQPNYSFLSPSTTTQTSQTTEQAINQATQNAFTPVMMRSPEGVEAEAKTREQMKKWLAAGWTILTGAQTTTTTTEETTTTPTDTTITPTTPTRTGGGGTNITVGNKSGTGGFGFGFKNWGEKVDWSNPDSIKTFVENSTQGLLDPGTGKKITEVGFGIAGPVGGALGAAASTVPSLGSLSDLRASRFILQAQGMETDFVDAQIKKITDNASGFTNFIDNVFKEVADGDAKARAALDRLRLEYTRDEKTGDPIFSDEQKIANRAKLKKPATGGDAAPGPSGGRGTIYEKPGDREAAIKPVGSGRGTIYEKPGDRQEAARKAAAERRKKKDKKFFSSQSGKKSITSAEKKKLDTRKSKATKGYKGGRAEGGLMNKKGNK